jgi:hypothetical protein
MKKSGMTIVILAAIFFAPSALALITLTNEFTLPADENIKVTVESTVDEISPGEYLYTYQISDIGELYLTLLSVPLLSPLEQNTEIYDFTYEGSDPIYWGAILDPAVAAQALFSPASLTGGTSAIFKFKSSYSEQTVQGYVSDAQLGSLYGQLLAPVPEPLTLSLLALGAGVLVCNKNKRNTRLG